MSDLPNKEQLYINFSDRINVSQHLNRVKEKIMVVWESRVRETISSAFAKSTPVLRNHLPGLIENLILSISPKSTNIDSDKTVQIGQAHGEQRAALLDYTASQVLCEYRILRQVIFEVLEEEQIQTSHIRDVILDILDAGIEKAIGQFSNVRSEELNRSNRDLENFAALAAHDLKSPLATISGYTELLHESLLGKIGVDETKYLQTIQKSSARMTLLIDRMLEYSAVGRQIKPFENVSMNLIVANIIETLKPVIENSQAQVHFDQLPVVLGDTSLLSQLFQNFISNSLKFKDPNKSAEITISAKQEGPFWLFTIQDNGLGFATEDKENVFSLFKRLDVVKTRSGSGIGLATARKVVELHGGKVWAESRPGQGATFFFTLPNAVEIN